MASLHGGTEPLALLTTVFTPPCSTSWLVTTTKLPSQFPSFPSAGPTTCDPPAWAANLAGEGFQYYSPAICPDGFRVGQECSIVSRTRTAEGFPAVDAGETVAWCVPVGHTCTSDTTDFRGGIWGVSRTASDVGAVVTVGPAMQIRWRDSDLSLLATHPLTPGLVLAGSTTAPARPPPATITPDPRPSVTVAPVPPPSPTSPVASDNESSTESDDDEESTETNATFFTATGQSTPTVATTTSKAVTSQNTGRTASQTSGQASTASSSTRGVSPVTPVSPTETPDETTATTDIGVAGPVTTPVSESGASTTAGNTNSSNAQVNSDASPDGKSNKKILIAAAVAASVLSTMAIVMGVFAFIVRRRRRRQQTSTTFTGETSQPEMSAAQSESSGNTSTGWSSLTNVGLGAWAHRRQAWLRSEWWSAKWQAWIPPFSLARQASQRSQTGRPVSRRHTAMDLPSTLWRRQQERNKAILRQFRPSKEPWSQALPFNENVIEARHARHASHAESQQEHDLGDDEYNAAQEKTEAQIQVTNEPDKRMPSNAAAFSKAEQRWSWVSRFVRDMRGDNASAPPDTPSSETRPRTMDMSDAGSSRPTSASTRWSRATEAVDYEASWETFSKAQGGAAKLIFLAKARHGGEPSRGLTVPDVPPIPRESSPAATTQSNWTSGRTARNDSRTRSAATLRDSNNRLSRLSDGTFGLGRLGSVVSRESQQERAGQASPM